MYKIIIADDHPIFRSGIREVISNLPGMQLMGEAKDGMEAYQMILATQPDIAVLDLEMPLLSGLDVCKKVLSEKHATRFIILTMHKEKHFFSHAMEAGVKGYLLKDNAVEELVKCIEAVRLNQPYYSAEIERFLVEGIELPEEVKQRMKQLTPTEKVLVKLISQGKTSPEIADNLFVSVNTVENHRYNISKKLNLEGKNSLLKFAIQYKDLL